MRDYSEWWYTIIQKATFKELLDKDKAVSTHTRNLQILATQMFKVKLGESPSIMHEIFQIDDSNNYNLRENRRFKPIVFLKQCIMELKSFCFRPEVMDNFT